MTHIQFLVEDVALEKLRLECKVGRSIPVYVALCYARILNIHSTSPEMSRACIHLGAHEHPGSNYTCRESLNMAYQ